MPPLCVAAAQREGPEEAERVVPLLQARPAQRGGAVEGGLGASWEGNSSRAPGGMVQPAHRAGMQPAGNLMSQQQALLRLAQRAALCCRCRRWRPPSPASSKKPRRAATSRSSRWAAPGLAVAPRLAAHLCSPACSGLLCLCPGAQWACCGLLAPALQSALLTAAPTWSTSMLRDARSPPSPAGRDRGL